MIIGFEIEKRSLPLYILPLSYLILAMIFPDRWKYAAGLILALVLFLGSYGLGKRLSYFLFKIADQTLYFPLGLGVVLAVVYAIAEFTTAPMLFYLIWGALALLAAFETPVLSYRLRRVYFWAAPFVLLGYWSTLTPVLFFDSLVYHLGLPYQYLAAGEMSVLPYNMFSAFPPFDQVLNLLFLSMDSICGLKAFSIVMYLQIIAVLSGLLRVITAGGISVRGGNGRDREATNEFEFARTEFLAILMLLLPAAWILVHILTAELLLGLFFCSGVIFLTKEFEALSWRKLFTAALFFAFSAWTKSNVMLYVFFVFVLWFSLNRWRFSIESLKKLGLLFAMILILLLPFFIRNYLTVGDPLYPAFAGVFSVKNWSNQQSIALQADISAPQDRGIKDIFLTPFLLTFLPQRFGSAAPIGLVYLISVIVYPFARKFKAVNRILLYVLFCYLAWLYVLRDFRQFFPPFILLGFLGYTSFFYLFQRSRQLFTACVALSAAVSLYFIYPVYRHWFPMILPGQSEAQYLEEHLDYYPIAKAINELQTTEKILTLGETRGAYITKPLMLSSAFDQNPFFLYLAESKSAEDLYSRMREDRIGFLYCNWAEYRRLALKCLTLPTDVLPQQYGVVALQEASKRNVKLPQLSEEKRKILQTFFSSYVSLVHREGNSMFLYRIGKAHE